MCAHRPYFRMRTRALATSVNGRPTWLPGESEHVEATREEIRQALDREKHSDY